MGVKKNNRPLTLRDFLPAWCLPRENKDPEIIERKLRATLSALAKQNQPHGQ